MGTSFQSGATGMRVNVKMYPDDRGEKNLIQLYKRNRRRMMRKALWFFGILLIVVLLLLSEVKNADKPLRGEWDFKLVKEWEIDSAGADVFGVPSYMQVSDEGTLYVYDKENKNNYMFDRNGAFIKTYGRKGQGPGEARDQSSLFLVDDKLLIVDIGRIHYFQLDGTYLESSVNSLYSRRPVLFLNSNEFMAVPLGLFEAPDFQAQIKRINLESGQETVIANFEIFKGGIGQAGKMVGSLIIPGLTPLMTVGYGNRRLYYGRSDTYNIQVTDLNGRLLNTFSLDRKKKSVPKDIKRQFFGRYSSMRKQALDQIIETTPNEATYFCRIEVHMGLIYVFVPDISRHNQQQIDIFSPEGKYLYRGIITIEDNLTMMEPQIHNPYIKDDWLYLSVMDENDNVKIIKYKISLPELRDVPYSSRMVQERGRSIIPAIKSPFTTQS